MTESTTDHLIYKTFSEVERLMAEDAEPEKVLSTINAAASTYRKQVNHATRDFHKIAKLFRRIEYPLKKEIYQSLLRFQTAERASEKLTLFARKMKIPLTGHASFTASCNMRARVKQLMRVPESAIIAKDAGYRLADLLNVRRPKSDGNTFKAHNVPFFPGSVVKPVASQGSLGVFIFRNDGSVMSVIDSTVLESAEECREKMIKLIKDKRIISDTWISEEYISSDPDGIQPASDLKFYCFYGSCPLILEVVRFPEKAYGWMDRNGKPVKTGKYGNIALGSNGFPKDAYDLALKISSEIPAPFIRIDFLMSHDGPVLCEFTGHPGDYHSFTRTYDKILGEEFLLAEQRLVEDMLKGKKFDAFLRLT